MNERGGVIPAQDGTIDVSLYDPGEPTRTLTRYVIGPPTPVNDPATSVVTLIGPIGVGVGNITSMDKPMPVSLLVHTGMFDPNRRPPFGNELAGHGVATGLDGGGFTVGLG